MKQTQSCPEGRYHNLEFKGFSPHGSSIEDEWGATRGNKPPENKQKRNSNPKTDGNE
jgi:hypothetical protein